MTARSYGVREGVTAGRFGVGLAIDFFGLSAKAQGAPVGFTYPQGTPLIPANIALVKNALHPKAAQAFVNFVMSPAGQRLLFAPEISRLPALPQVYAAAPPDHPNPYDAGFLSKGMPFDTDLSRRRYHLVNALFDKSITFRLRELNQAWRALHEAESGLRGRPGDRRWANLKRARDLLGQVPVRHEEAADPAFSSRFVYRKPGLPVPRFQAEAEAGWEKSLRRMAKQAMELIDAAGIGATEATE